MKKLTLAAALGCAVCLLAATASFAGPEHHGRISPQQKQASDQAIQAGLGQLQAAAAAIQQGNGGGAISDLQAAESALTSALPIYHGHREHAMHAADHAIKELQANRKKSLEHASVSVGKAISEAQAALQSN